MVKTELEDLHCAVHPTSQHICPEKVDDLDNNLLRHYCEKAEQRGLTIKTTAKRSLSFNKSDDPSTSFPGHGNSQHQSTIVKWRASGNLTNINFDAVLDQTSAT